tara:strand:- start:247 stop:402 length:156 start_codon:yes stop_codon:yes gene_type:complete
MALKRQKVASESDPGLPSPEPGWDTVVFMIDNPRRMQTMVGSMVIQCVDEN